MSVVANAPGGPCPAKQARRLLESDLGVVEKALDAALLKAAVQKYVDRAISDDAAPDDKENRVGPGAPEAAHGAKRKRSRQKDVVEDDSEDEQEDESEKEQEDGFADDDDDDDDDEEEEEEEEEERKPRKGKAKKSSSTSSTRKGTGAAKATAPSSAQMSPATAKLRDLCKRAGLAYQHVFMKHKTDAGRQEALATILDKAGLSRGSDGAAVARVRAARDRERELDGIDASNVIEGGRRRRAASTNQWGESIDYAALNGKGRGGGSDSDESAEEDSGDDSDDEEVVMDDDDSEEEAEVEAENVEAEEDEEAERGRTGNSPSEAPSPAPEPKAVRRAKVLYSDSDED